MAIYGTPARSHQHPVQGPDGKWYSTAAAAAKPSATPRRDAVRKGAEKPMAYLTLDAIRRIT